MQSVHPCLFGVVIAAFALATPLHGQTPTVEEFVTDFAKSRSQLIDLTENRLAVAKRNLKSAELWPVVYNGRKAGLNSSGQYVYPSSAAKIEVVIARRNQVSALEHLLSRLKRKELAVPQLSQTLRGDDFGLLGNSTAVVKQIMGDVLIVNGRLGAKYVFIDADGKLKIDPPEEGEFTVTGFPTEGVVVGQQISLSSFIVKMGRHPPIAPIAGKVVLPLELIDLQAAKQAWNERRK